MSEKCIQICFHKQGEYIFSFNIKKENILWGIIQKSGVIFLLWGLGKSGRVFFGLQNPSPPPPQWKKGFGPNTKSGKGSLYGSDWDGAIVCGCINIMYSGYPTTNREMFKEEILPLILFVNTIKT